ncbi:hypothetical protein AB00_2350 [Raoultella ornithinolytica 2-156-04_S1_C1]|nr:hypothetical protein AB00_2350 [Raoultella ornithinolytica 2-156-04_S1_C1]
MACPGEKNKRRREIAGGQDIAAFLCLNGDTVTYQVTPR